MGFPAANPDADAEEPALLLSEEWGRIKVPIEDRLFGENRNRALEEHVIQSYTGSNRKRGRDWSHYRSRARERQHRTGSRRTPTVNFEHTGISLTRTPMNERSCRGESVVALDCRPNLLTASWTKTNYRPAQRPE